MIGNISISKSLAVFGPGSATHTMLAQLHVALRIVFRWPKYADIYQHILILDREFYRCVAMDYSISSIMKNAKLEKYIYNYIECVELRLQYFKH